MIIAKPNGGLGNRMRVINSAICLATANHKLPVKVLWKRNSGMNALFSDLFGCTDEISIVQNPFLMGCYFYFPKLMPVGYKYYDDQLISVNNQTKEYWDKNHSNVILNTCFDFYELKPETNFYQLFQPVEKLQKKIEQISNGFRESMVGVHIRRTDHVPAVNYSKTENFITRMDELVDENRDTGFYVSTDDIKTESKIRNRFGSRIHSMSDKNLERNTKEGIEDAVVDMYCLSHTKMILGSYSSSFSAVASAIGKIPLEIIALNPGN